MKLFLLFNFPTEEVFLLTFWRDHCCVYSNVPSSMSDAFPIERVYLIFFLSFFALELLLILLSFAGKVKLPLESALSSFNEVFTSFIFAYSFFTFVLRSFPHANSLWLFEVSLNLFRCFILLNIEIWLALDSVYEDSLLSPLKLILSDGTLIDMV